MRKILGKAKKKWSDVLKEKLGIIHFESDGFSLMQIIFSFVLTTLILFMFCLWTQWDGMGWDGVGLVLKGYIFD